MHYNDRSSNGRMTDPSAQEPVRPENLTYPVESEIGSIEALLTTPAEMFMTLNNRLQNPTPRIKVVNNSTTLSTAIRSC